MDSNEQHKLSLYFPEDMIAEIQATATRLDRSLSWVLQNAWKVARPRIKQIPSPDEMGLRPAPPAPKSNKVK